MKKITSFFILPFLSFICFQTVQAQSNRFGNSPSESSLNAKGKNKYENSNGNDNDNGNLHNNEVPYSAPFDGGMGLLLAAGVVYGFKKVKDRQHEARQNAEFLN